MMSLFNSFDLFFFYLHWFYFIVLFIFLMNFNYKLSYFYLMWSLLWNLMSCFFETLKPTMFGACVKSFFFSIMIMILVLNILSIFPFNFSMTSQVSIVLLISLTLWISFIFFQFINNIKSFIIHCVPEGTPIYLTWFLFLIELVSNLIRPITLTVRLVANILAGHLLMILLSKMVMLYSSTMIFYLALNLIELFVGLIQSYIFITMICLYFVDVQ